MLIKPINLVPIQHIWILFIQMTIQSQRQCSCVCTTMKFACTFQQPLLSWWSELNDPRRVQQFIFVLWRRRYDHKRWAELDAPLPWNPFWAERWRWREVDDSSKRKMSSQRFDISYTNTSGKPWLGENLRSTPGLMRTEGLTGGGDVLANSCCVLLLPALLASNCQHT